MTNRKYSSEYAKTSSKLLRSLTSGLMPLLAPTKLDANLDSSKKGSNLMNKSLPFMKKGKLYYER